MQTHEYKVVPAPSHGEKARGLKTPAERFSHALALVMNDLARDGWEYLRTDTLPSEERTGLAKRSTVYHSVLVFRRPLAAAIAPAEPPRKLLSTEPPAGRAPAITLSPEGEAPRLGAAEPRG